MLDQEVYEASIRLFFHDANARMTKFATDALASFAEGDLLKTLMMGVKRFTKYPPQNVKNYGRKLADFVIDKNTYCF